MKTQELQVTCIYTEDGPDIQDVINASFSLLLRRELDSLTSVEHPGDLPE